MSGEMIPELTHDQVKKALDDVDAAYQDLLFRLPDRDGQAAYVRDLLNSDMGVTQMRLNIAQSQEYKDKHPSGPTKPPSSQPLPILRTAGRIFQDTTQNNAPWRWKGVSAFALMDRFLKGEDIGPFLNAYKGFNVLRVWPYTDWTNGWGYPNPPSVADIRRFLSFTQNLGWLVELTLLTTDEGRMLEWAKGVVPQLAADPKPGNLLIEIGNEPTTHKTIKTEDVKAMCEASGFLYASGNYEDATKMFGKWGNSHPQRDSEWPRRAHDLLEFYNGGGPHKPTDPSHKFPQVGDETAKPQDVKPPAAPNTKADDYRAYFGAASLLGAGATFHCESAKYAQLPNDEEQACRDAALEGLNAFPADAPNGPYSRPNDSSLRTYIVGNYMVRIRPTTPSYGTGWVRIGTSNILWRKG